MAKSPISRGSKQVRATQNRKNILPITMTMPHKSTSDRTAKSISIKHLAHLGCNKDNAQIQARAIYIRNFAKKATEYVDNGQSARSVTNIYEHLGAYILFCDNKSVDPFSKEGYLKHFGNDGELRHQVKQYNPSLKLWQRKHGDELGLKTSSCLEIQAGVIAALTWCGAFDASWRHLHRPFQNIRDPYKAYSDADEKMIVSRLSDLFFSLAPQLIAINKNKSLHVNELPVKIDFGSYQEELHFETSLKSKVSNGKANYTSAFNITMGAAYHLFCYFTSLNDSQVKAVCHPLTIETDRRDKSLKTIKVKAFKSRANKDVSAVFTNEMDGSIAFDVEKKSGVAFIEVLSELSSLYSDDTALLYQLDSNGEVASKFNIRDVNKHLVTLLNLVTSHRAIILPWLSELYYTYQKGEAITLKTVTNEMGRRAVSKTNTLVSVTTKSLLGLSYLILSCFTNKSLKGALLPLTYADKDENGNVRVSFLYDNGEQGFFDIPITKLQLIKDIDAWATNRADKAHKIYPRYLLRYAGLHYPPKQWIGFNPISSTKLRQWGIGADDYFLALQSSRFRETTSIQEYQDGHLAHLANLLQNTLTTLETHYANGNPETNKKVLSQAIQVLEQISSGNSLEKAKKVVTQKLQISMLTHDEWLEKKTPTNPNGVLCNGKKATRYGKNTQVKTNYAIGQYLPCSEYDMCYKCNSARAVDEPNSIYKLMSFIDVLKEALDHHPAAKQEVQEKIDAFEYTLGGASLEVLEEATHLFNKNGRHPRVTMNHAKLSIYR